MFSLNYIGRVTVGALSTILLASSALAGSGHLNQPSYTPDLVPANPVAGECYARVEIPAQYDNQRQGVIVEEGYSDIQITQPQLAARTEQVLVKEASVRYQVRQPSYSTVTEQVLVRPAYDKLRVSPPQFRTVTETVQSSSPRLVWKKGNPGALRSQGYVIHSTADGGVGGGGYRSTRQYGQSSTDCGPVCEIWCLVEEPGETVSFDRKVMTAPAQVQRVAVPPKYSSISKQVVSDPGGVTEIPVPAEYRSITVEDVVSHGGERYVTVPPKYASVDKKTLISSERYEWRRVVCKPGTLPALPTGASLSSSHSGSSYSSSASTTTGSIYSGSTYSGSTSGSGYSSTYGSGSGYTGSAAHSGTSSYGTGSYSGGTYSSGSSQTHDSGSNDQMLRGAGFKKRVPWRLRR